MSLPNVLRALLQSRYLQELELEQLILFCRLCSLLKRDILLYQPQNESDPSTPPTALPQSIRTFLASAVGLEGDKSIVALWDILKHDIWLLDPPSTTSEDLKIFECHGWEIGMTMISLYPPSDICQNSDCQNHRYLKKRDQREVVVYTASHGPQPAYSVHLYCHGCHTNYQNNYFVRNGIRIYYGGVPKYIQVGEHQFVEDIVVRLWTGQMLYAWVSATNAAKLYQMLVPSDETSSSTLPQWKFGTKLTTEHVWDAFVTLALLEDHHRLGTYLTLPHDGSQHDRFQAAMEKRNHRIVLEGQPDATRHSCKRCMRGTSCQAVVGDGINMGRPCCSVFRCKEPLQSIRHRFCRTHYDNHQICAVTNCTNAVRQSVPPARKFMTCANPDHSKMEELHVARGKAAFTLTERLRNSRHSYPTDAVSHTSISPELSSTDTDEIQWFEGSGPSIEMFSAPRGVSTGVTEEQIDADCPSKSVEGNRKFKAQFSRRRTHNEQTLVWPCGVILARATFYGAEAVSNFLVMVKNTFSVPGARKPEHLFYDSNCDAKQQARGDPFFDSIGMCVDVFHFLHKHKTSHKFCQENCNPALYPELMIDGREWYFNTSIAEQTNAWLGGYQSILREMTAVKYDFFLDEMIRLRNIEILHKLKEDGHQPQVREYYS